MELRHVRYFIAVAEVRSFTRAAERIGIAQPPLSQQIKALEVELGAPLFARLPHGAELTAAGLAFLEEARTLIRQAERARQTVARVAGGLTGVLRLGMTASAVFHPITLAAVRRFRERFPDVELALTQHDTEALFEFVTAGALDAAFVRPGPAAPEPLSILRFPDEATVAVVPAAHALARKRQLRLSMLSGETLLLFPRRAGTAFYDEVIAACHRAQFQPRRTIDVPQMTAMPSFVSAGVGVALVPASLAAIGLHDIAYVAIAGEAPVAPFALTWGSASPSTLNFVSIAGAIGTG